MDDGAWTTELRRDGVEKTRSGGAMLKEDRLGLEEKEFLRSFDVVRVVCNASERFGVDDDGSSDCCATEERLERTSTLGISPRFSS